MGGVRNNGSEKASKGHAVANWMRALKNDCQRVSGSSRISGRVAGMRTFTVS